MSSSIEEEQQFDENTNIPEKFKDTICYMCHKQGMHFAGTHRGIDINNITKTLSYTFYYSCKDHKNEVGNLVRDHQRRIIEHEKGIKRYE